MKKKTAILMGLLMCMGLFGCSKGTLTEAPAISATQEAAEKDEIVEFCSRPLADYKNTREDDRLPKTLLEIVSRESISAYYCENDAEEPISYVLIAEVENENEEESFAEALKQLAQERQNEIITEKTELAAVSHMNGYWILSVGDDCKDTMNKFAVIMNRPEKVKSPQQIMDLLLNPIDPIAYLSESAEEGGSK